jgi:hypothetical protein
MPTPARTTRRAIMAIGCVIALNAPVRASQEAQNGRLSAPGTTRMPIQQVNELVRTRCAVCHSGEHPKGGLSVEQFDAAAPDPALARMLWVKMAKDGAIFAAGGVPPDAATLELLLRELSAIADTAPSDGWKVDVAPDQAKGGHNVVTATIVQAVSTTERPSSLYGLTITCSGRTQRGEMTLAAYSQRTANAQMTLRALSPAKNGAIRFGYEVDGGTGEMATLYVGMNNATAPMALVPIPARTLTIRDLIVGETVVFPFDRLSPVVRRQLASCVPKPIK